MKRLVIVTALLSLSACADFAPGTKVAPGFPDDRFELSHNTKVPDAQEPATLGQLGR